MGWPKRKVFIYYADVCTLDIPENRRDRLVYHSASQFAPSREEILDHYLFVLFTVVVV